MTLQKIEFMYDIPEGYRFVRIGKPLSGEMYLNTFGKVMKASFDYGGYWIIVEEIPEQEQSTSQPELKLQYKTQQGDWRDVNDGYEYRIKPKTKIVRFRNWISCSGNIYVASESEQIGQDHKWLGDWQEVEIEEND